jgi:hypothetical protein
MPAASLYAGATIVIVGAASVPSSLATSSPHPRRARARSSTAALSMSRVWTVLKRVKYVRANTLVTRRRPASGPGRSPTETSAPKGHADITLSAPSGRAST